MADTVLRHPTSLSFHRRAARRLTPEQASQVATFWREQVAGRPADDRGGAGGAGGREMGDSLPRAESRHVTSYDTPIVEARTVEWFRSHVRISWSETSYAYYLWRRARRAEQVDVSPAHALYVAVLLVTTDGHAVVGQRGGCAGSGEGLQLPGRCLAPPERAVRPVTVDDAAAVAARELRGQLGLAVPPGELSLWAVAEGRRFGDVAVVFRLLRGMGLDEVHAAFARHVQASAGRGEQPELSRLVAFPVAPASIPARPVGSAPGSVPGAGARAGIPDIDWADILPAVLRGVGADPSVPGLPLRPDISPRRGR